MQEHKADAGEDYLDLPVTTTSTTTTTIGPSNNNLHHSAMTKSMVSGTGAGAGQHMLSPNFPEVRITQQGKPRNYISYAMNLFVSPRNMWCWLWIAGCALPKYDAGPYTSGTVIYRYLTNHARTQNSVLHRPIWCCSR